MFDELKIPFIRTQLTAGFGNEYGYPPEFQCRVLKWLVSKTGWRPAEKNDNNRLSIDHVLGSVPRMFNKKWSLWELTCLENLLQTLRFTKSKILVYSWHTLYYCIWNGPTKMSDQIKPLLLKYADVFHLDHTSRDRNGNFKETLVAVYTFVLPPVSFLGDYELEKLLFDPAYKIQYWENLEKKNCAPKSRRSPTKFCNVQIQCTKCKRTKYPEEMNTVYACAICMPRTDQQMNLGKIEND